MCLLGRPTHTQRHLQTRSIFIASTTSLCSKLWGSTGTRVITWNRWCQIDGAQGRGFVHSQFGSLLFHSQAPMAFHLCEVDVLHLAYDNLLPSVQLFQKFRFPRAFKRSNIHSSRCIRAQGVKMVHGRINSGRLTTFDSHNASVGGDSIN